MKTSTKWWVAVGAVVTGLLVGLGIYEEVKKPAASGGGGGPTRTLSLGLVPGNLGVVVLPYGAAVLLVAPQGAVLQAISPSPLFRVASTTQAYSVMGTAAFNSAPATTTLVVDWTDTGGTAQQTTVAIAPQTATTGVTLQPSTPSSPMEDVTLAAAGGQIIFAPPSGGSITGAQVSGPGLTVSQGAASVGFTATGSAAQVVATITWTDASSTPQSSTVGIATVLA